MPALTRKTVTGIPGFLSAAGPPGWGLIGWPLCVALVARQRSEEFATVDASALVQVIYTIMLFAIALYHIGNGSVQARRVVSRLKQPPLCFLLAYTVICMVSAVWSSNLKYSLFMAFQAFSFFLIICLVVDRLIARGGKQQAAEWVLLFGIWEIASAITQMVRMLRASAVLSPYVFHAARLSAPCYMYLCFLVPGQKILGGVIWAFSILSFSNKVYVGVVAGLAPLSLWLRGRWRALAVGGSAIFALGVLLFGEWFLLSTVLYGRESVGLEASTGRGTIWAAAIDASMEHPILGYGFAFDERYLIAERVSAAAINAHNAFLSALIGTGMVGLGLLLLFFGSLAYNLWQSPLSTRWKAFLMATVVHVTVMALLGPGLGSRVYGGWVANCLVLVLVSMVTSEATGTKAVDRQRRRAPLRSRGMNPTRMTMPTNHRQGPR